MVSIELPRYRFADANKNWVSVSKQLEHLKSEVKEAETELLMSADYDRAKEELIDVIHSAGTLLYILEADIEKENLKVIEKNKARGYMEKQESEKQGKQSCL